MIYYQRSEQGLVRKNNEDSVSCKFIGDTLCIVMADGLGGCDRGEVASSIATTKMIEFLDLNSEIVSKFDEKALTDMFNDAYQKINNAIAIKASNEKSDMATTLSVVLLSAKKIFISHIGDCRTYFLHGSKLERLTKDHTVAAKLNESDVNNESRNVLTKYLGENCFITPDIYRYNIMYGDLVLLCTDGLYANLEEVELKEILRKHASLEQCANDLVNAVYANGANDNVSLVLAHNKPSK